MQRTLTRSWQLTIPLFTAFLGFATASFSNDIALLSVIILATIFLIGAFFKKADLVTLMVVLTLSMFAFWLAVWRVDLETPAFDSVAHLPQREIVLEGRISNYQAREEVTRLVLNQVQYGNELRADKVLLTIQRPLAAWQVGDRLRVSCRASVPKADSYRQYLAARNIHMTCTTRDEPVHLGRDITFGALSWKLRENFEDHMRSRFAEPYATLLTGLYIGEVSFSAQYQDIFKATGITHIVAASGYNVSVTAVLVFGLLAAIGVRRQDACWWILLSIIAFVIIAGASAPVVRAGIMGAVVLFGRTMGRQGSIRNILLLTIVSMLFVQPLWLYNDVGFQLSVISTWGLIYLSDFFLRAFHFVPETLGLRESISTTFAATLATTPILLIVFEQVSLLSPIANLLILPLLPYVLLFGAVAFLAPAHPVFLAIPWLGLEWTLRTTEALGSLSFALVSIDHVMMRIIISVLATLLCLSLVIFSRERLRLVSSLFALLR